MVNLLHRFRLEDRFWTAPSSLQHWLTQTYENELQVKTKATFCSEPIAVPVLFVGIETLSWTLEKPGYKCPKLPSEQL